MTKGNYDKPCPAGEGGPQRKRISRRIREMIDAVAVDEVPIKPLITLLNRLYHGATEPFLPRGGKRREATEWPFTDFSHLLFAKE